MFTLNLICLVVTSATLWIFVTSKEIEGGIEQLAGDLNGPVTFDFLTPSSIVTSERTALSLIDLTTGKKTLLAGSATLGGYIDGENTDARFSLINDVVVQGNYIYIADYSCVRIYDIERMLVGTLSGICGRIEEMQPSPSVAPPVFRGHLKLAASARELYVLDGDRVSRVDKETGAVWALSTGRFLSEGRATSIEVDRYSNSLFVAVAYQSEVYVIAIDILSGKQSLHTRIQTSSTNSDSAMTVTVASLDVAPDGTIYVLEPRALHAIDSKTRKVSNKQLKDYGYHEVAVSSEYLILSQEFYSRMYRLHLMNVARKVPTEGLERSHRTQVITAGGDKDQLKMFEPQTFYVAIVLPSLLFILLIIVTLCAAKKCLKNKSERKCIRPTSDGSSEKYFLNEDRLQDSRYWM